MDFDGRTYSWQPLPENAAEKLNQLSDEALSGDVQRVAKRANTILATPSTQLIGELTRISGPEISFRAEPISDDESLEQYAEYEALYERPYVIGRFMGCVALREANGGEDLACEVSVETHTGGFLFAQIPLRGAQIEIDAPPRPAK